MIAETAAAMVANHVRLGVGARLFRSLWHIKNATKLEHEPAIKLSALIEVGGVGAGKLHHDQLGQRQWPSQGEPSYARQNQKYHQTEAIPHRLPRGARAARGAIFEFCTSDGAGSAAMILTLRRRLEADAKENRVA